MCPYEYRIIHKGHQGWSPTIDSTLICDIYRLMKFRKHGKFVRLKSFLPSDEGTSFCS